MTPYDTLAEAELDEAFRIDKGLPEPDAWNDGDEVVFQVNRGLSILEDNGTDELMPDDGTDVLATEPAPAVTMEMLENQILAQSRHIDDLWQRLEEARRELANFHTRERALLDMINAYREYSLVGGMYKAPTVSTQGDPLRENTVPLQGLNQGAPAPTDPGMPIQGPTDPGGGGALRVPHNPLVYWQQMQNAPQDLGQLHARTQCDCTMGRENLIARAWSGIDRQVERAINSLK